MGHERPSGLLKTSSVERIGRCAGQKAEKYLSRVLIRAMVKTIGGSCYASSTLQSRDLGRYRLSFITGAGTGAKPSADAFLQKWDTDHDGTLSHAEINKAASTRFDALDRKHKHVLTRNQLAGMLTFQQFRKVDKDKDGTIDKAEFLAVVDKLFRVADKDHDGTLDRDKLNSSAGRALRRLFGARHAPIF